MTTAADILFYGCKDSGFAPYEEYWRLVRKICVVELLSLSSVRSFQFVREEEVGVVIDKIRDAAVNGDAVNLTEMLMAVSSNIVSRCVLSRKAEEDDGSSKFRKSSRRVVVIEKHGALRGQDDDKRDFISIILQLQKDGMLGIDLAQDNIKSNFIGLQTLSDLSLFPSPNPLSFWSDGSKRDKTCGWKQTKGGCERYKPNGIPKKCDQRTLRLHPAVAFVVRRGTSESIKLEGYDIPTNTTVFISIWGIQRDPNWWERPEDFFPERFENSTVDFKCQDFHFIPFGCGRRDCPGMSFGVASVEYLLANLVYWFDWEVA
ncbi:hypothetical protein PTKIN_Ptkin05aG0192100 [Pterospermum kingtungense]